MLRLLGFSIFLQEYHNLREVILGVPFSTAEPFSHIQVIISIINWNTLMTTIIIIDIEDVVVLSRGEVLVSWIDLLSGPTNYIPNLIPLVLTPRIDFRLSAIPEDPYLPNLLALKTTELLYTGHLGELFL